MLVSLLACFAIEYSQQCDTMWLALYGLLCSQDYMPLLTQYVALLARILLQNVETFVEVLTHYGQQRNLSVSCS